MADDKKKLDAQAAEKVAKAAKSNKPPKKKNPNGNFFVRAGKGIAHFFKDFKAELKKIVWPDFKSVMKNTGVAIVVILVIGIGIWLVDFGLTQGLKGLRNLAADEPTTAVTEVADEETTTGKTIVKTEEATKETTTKAE